jgi:protein required for attachment to host cells
MDTIWVLVADKSHAKLYSRKGRSGELLFQQSWDHAASRSHEQELTSDLPGRAFDSTGDARHAMGQPVDPKDHEAELFAHELIAEMEKGRNGHLFLSLYLMAPPEFLGLLRKQCGAPLQKLVAGEVDKGLTAADAKTVREHLPGVL